MLSDVLPDVLTPNLAVVFCGTAASTKSAAVGAYYAGPGNRFWRTLQEIGLTPHLLAPSEFQEAPAYGVGFTDLAKHTAGQDSELKPEDFDATALRAKIEEFAPRVVAFNGKRAGSVVLGIKSPCYGLQPDSLSPTAVFVLPSTSAAAKQHWDVGYWYELAAFLRGGDCDSNG